MAAARPLPRVTMRDRTDFFKAVRKEKVDNRYKLERLTHKGAGPMMMEMSSLAPSASQRSYSKLQEVVEPDEIAFRSKLPPNWALAIEEVNDILAELQASTMPDLVKCHRKHLLPVFGDSVELETQIETLTQQVTARFRRCEQLIKGITASVSGSTQEEHMQHNVQVSLASKVHELTIEFRKAQQEYIAQLQAREASTKANFLGLDFDTSSSARVDTSFTTEQQAQVAMRQADMERRNAEIMAVATSVNELADLFKDLSMLVIDQGTMLDTIEHNISSTLTHTERALEETEKAEKYQIAYRKKQCIYLLLVLCMAMTMIYLSYGRSRRRNNANN